MAGRVMVFIDGGNFEGSCRAIDPNLTHQIDFEKLSTTLVKHAGGDSYQGTYYYCSFRPQTAGMSQQDVEKIRKQIRFYDALQYKNGYTVKKFRRKTRSARCAHCSEERNFTIEKGVDSTLVSDLLSLAWENAFDKAVVLSDDADFVSAIEYLRRKGIQVFHASFVRLEHGKAVRKVCFAVIDLETIRTEITR